MKLGAMIVGLALSTACATTGNVQESTTDVAVEGTYEFSAALPGRAARGRLLLMSDTVLIDSDVCGMLQSMRSEIRVGCRGIQATSSAATYNQNNIAILTFDRRNPAVGGDWRMNVSVERQRQVCAGTEVRNGREVCVSRRMEKYQVNEWRTGTIHVRRTPY